MQPPNLDTKLAALSAAEAGVSLLPIDATTKRPLTTMLPLVAGKASWEPYQTTPAEPSIVASWFDRGCQSFAGVCGAVSANLLVIDFDEADLFVPWTSNFPKGLLESLVIQQTGSGMQVWIRRDGPVGGNEKLAWVPDAESAAGRSIAIETRGEGGYAVMAPSLHPNGKRYELFQGSWDAIPTLPAAKVEELLLEARKLCRAPFSKQETSRAKAAVSPRKAPGEASNDSGGVITAFNAKTPLADVLARYGYAPAYAGRYNRPGGETASVMISSDGQRSYHFSSNDPLNDGHQQDAFNVYCKLGHNRNVGEAVKAAARELGMDRLKPQPVKKSDHVVGSNEMVVVDREPDGLRTLIEKTVSGERRNVAFKGKKLTLLTRALLPETATILCGRPGGGKSFWMLDELFNWFVNGERVACKMLEKSHTWHMNRALAQIAGEPRLLDPTWVRENGALALELHDKHESVLREFGKCIHDCQNEDGLDDLVSWVERKAGDDGCRIIGVDPVTKANGQSAQPWLDDKKFVNDLERIQKRYGMSNLLVSHPKGGGRPGDDPLDNIAGGRSYSRFTDTVLVLQSHRASPRPCMVKGGLMNMERPMWVTRSMSLPKTREGVGDGATLAIEMDPRTLRFSELGIITQELKLDQMDGLAPPVIG